MLKNLAVKNLASECQVHGALETFYVRIKMMHIKVYGILSGMLNLSLVQLHQT